MTGEYPYSECPNCGEDVDETELYVFCLNQDCGWSEELPDDPRFLDDTDEDDTTEEDDVLFDVEEDEE